MGAKNCPETPRQRMIAMIYLVLTALLALNVSKDILNAFIVVNESMEKTNVIFAQKTAQNYVLFDQALAENEPKTRPYYNKAQQAKKYADEMVAYIEDIKSDIISLTEGISKEKAKTISVRDLNKKDNYDVGTNYFIGRSTDGSGGKSMEFKNKIIEFKKNMLDLLSDKDKELVKIGLEVEGTFKDLSGKEMNWEMYTFYHTILVANVVLLNKLISDVRNAEADIVAQLFTSVGAGDFRFNKITARVVPKSKFIIQGEEYEAEIFVAAYDTLTAPEVIIGSGVDFSTLQVLGSTRTLEGVGGLVTYKVSGAPVGEHKYGGVIKIKSPGGGTQSFPFESEYNVSAPTATVSAEKMNVFYVGVDNPVSVSVPGIPHERVRVSITNGSISSVGRGKYIVRVSSGTETRVNVSADMHGQVRSMGSFDFRVRRFPPPIAEIAGVREGIIEKTRLVAAPTIIARMEGVEFDVSYTVTSYSFLMQTPGGDLVSLAGSGNRLSSEMIGHINAARRGIRCFIENIRASGPDGTRSIGSINLRLN